MDPKLPCRGLGRLLTDLVIDPHPLFAHEEIVWVGGYIAVPVHVRTDRLVEAEPARLTDKTGGDLTIGLQRHCHRIIYFDIRWP